MSLAQLSPSLFLNIIGAYYSGLRNSCSICSACLNTLLFGGRGFIKYQLTYFTGKRENFVLKRKQEVIPLGNLCLRIYDAKY